MVCRYTANLRLRNCHCFQGWKNHKLFLTGYRTQTLSCQRVGIFTLAIIKIYTFAMLSGMYVQARGSA